MNEVKIISLTLTQEERDKIMEIMNSERAHKWIVTRRGLDLIAEE